MKRKLVSTIIAMFNSFINLLSLRSRYIWVRKRERKKERKTHRYTHALPFIAAGTGWKILKGRRWESGTAGASWVVELTRVLPLRSTIIAPARLSSAYVHTVHALPLFLRFFPPFPIEIRLSFSPASSLDVSPLLSLSFSFLLHRRTGKCVRLSFSFLRRVFPLSHTLSGNTQATAPPKPLGISLRPCRSCSLLIAVVEMVLVVVVTEVVVVESQYRHIHQSISTVTEPAYTFRLAPFRNTQALSTPPWALEYEGTGKRIFASRTHEQ